MENSKLNSIKKYLLIFLGSLSLTLGIIGAFIPVLPTTPFLLLASFCYLRSSKKMYDWLINHKILGAYIYSYTIYKAVPRKTKIGALVFLWSTLTISIVFVPVIYIRIFLLVVGVSVTIHLLILKTLSPEEMRKLNKLYSKKAKAL